MILQVVSLIGGYHQTGFIWQATADMGQHQLDQLVNLSDQIIATSHDLGPQKVAEEGKWEPLFISGKSRLVKIFYFGQIFFLDNLPIFHLGFCPRIKSIFSCEFQTWGLYESVCMFYTLLPSTLLFL